MLATAPRIALATPRDRATVLTLLAEHLPGTDIQRRLDWLYDRNPHGPALTFLAFGPRGTPLGITSIFPRLVVIDGVVRMGSAGNDGYVRPAFRRAGVATALHAACLEAMREHLRTGEPRAIELMYGSPVPNNLRALERAGSRTITALRRFARPRLVHRALQALAFARVPARLEELVGADPRVAELWERVDTRSGILTVRDPAQYAWRFGALPDDARRPYALLEGGRAVAICVLERAEDRTAIIDFIAPQARFAAALRALCNAAGDAPLMMYVTDRSPFAGDLRRAGFIARERRGFQVLAPADHPAAATIFDPTRWYATWGDSNMNRTL